MFVYAIRDKKSGKIYSMKSSGGAFYSRKGDAKNKIANDQNLEVVEFLLNEVPNNTEIKGHKYLYKYKYLRDTVNVVDTIPIVITQEVTKEVNKLHNW